MRKGLSNVLIGLALWPILVFGQTRSEEVVQAVVGQNIAVAGEKIWIYMEARDTSGENYSRIGYAELINRSGNPVAQSIFQISSGAAQAYLELPPNLSSDHYLVRVYTRTSPLRGDAGIWNQFLTVINPKQQQRKITQSEKKNPYRFRSPESETRIGQIAPNKVHTLETSGSRKPLFITAALRNPFLPENLKGSIGSEIYETLPEDYPLIPEPYGHVVYARNTEKTQHQSETFYLSAHGDKSFLNSAKAKANGDLFFELGAMKDYNFLIVQSNQAESPMSFALQSPFALLRLKSDFHFPSLTINENQRDFINDIVISSQVGILYYEKKTVENVPIVVGFDEDRVYRLDDYTRFESFEITLKEYVPEVLVRRQNKKVLLKVLNKPLGRIFDENPLVLVDGMPIFEIDPLMEFDPIRIEKMEIMAREFLFNHERFDGVINIHSFDNDFGGFELPKNAIYLNYPLIQKSLLFMTPRINPRIGEERYPDFRNLMHWEIAHEGPIELHTSHIEGSYQLTLCYRNSEGKLEYFQSEFEVKR